MLLSKGKTGFVEDDMPRDDDLVGGKIKAAITFVVSRISKEDTQSKAGGELVSCCGGQVRIAGATKDTKMIIRRGEPSRAWCGVDMFSVLVGRRLRRCVAVWRASTQKVGGADA